MLTFKSAALINFFLLLKADLVQLSIRSIILNRAWKPQKLFAEVGR